MTEQSTTTVTKIHSRCEVKVVISKENVTARLIQIIYSVGTTEINMIRHIPPRKKHYHHFISDTIRIIMEFFDAHSSKPPEDSLAALFRSVSDYMMLIPQKKTKSGG